MSDFLAEFGMSNQEAQSFEQPSSGSNNNGNNWSNNNNQQGGGNHSGNNGNDGSFHNSNNNGGSRSWSNNNNSGGGNNYGGNSGGGNKNWKGGGKGGRRQDELKPPYMPVTIFIPGDYPNNDMTLKQNVVESLINLAKSLIEKGFTVRFNAEDKQLFLTMQGLSRTFTEGYTPFKDFNEIESGFCWKNISTEAIAKGMFGESWKSDGFSMPQTMAERNARLLFGSRNNSSSRMLITWTPDGAVKAAQCSRDTGFTRSIIEIADKYMFPIYNMNNEESRKAFVSTYLER